MSSAELIRHREDTLRATGLGPAAPVCPVGNVNVGSTERLVSQGLGGGLILAGVALGGWKGLVSALAGAGLMYRGTTGNCALYSAMGINSNEPEGAREGRGLFSAVPAGHGSRYEVAVIVDRPADELYAFWRDHANLTKFMEHVESVTSVDGVRSHWKMKGPMGVELEWDAEIFNDEPGHLIAWRSLPGSEIATAGSVKFTTVAQGKATEVRINEKFDPPGGQLGLALAKVLGSDPDELIRETLRTFKQLMEAGEIPTTSGQPTGRRPSAFGIG